MRGTANVPPKKIDSDSLEKLGAQAKLTGVEGQYVGFDKNGNASAKNPLTGTETQYIGFDKDGKQVAKDLPESDATVSSATAFSGTIGTEWTEDAETGVKYQLVEIKGVLASHETAVLDAVMTHDRTADGYAAFVEENNQFLEFITNGDAETVDGGVMFYIYGEPNTVEIPFRMVVC